MLHRLLLRQLKRLNLEDNIAPQTSEEWQEILQAVSKTYEENDRDRYTMERSLAISSREMSEVNEKLQMTNLKLLQADRMAAVGTLATGVAHEINNPLTYILVNLELALEELEKNGAPKNEKHLEGVLKTIHNAATGIFRIRDVVRDLKTFSRAESDIQEAIDLKKILTSAAKMANNEIRHRAQLLTDYKDLPLVFVNESRIAQVFLNLIINAAQSITPGNVSGNFIKIRVYEDSGKNACVEIEDSGTGIPEKNLNRIFDPFFTTKPKGIGTGLGLSICHNIITQYSGSISVQSKENKGTTFKVVLPRAPDSAQVPSKSKKHQTIKFTAARGRILIIDDETNLTDILQKVLTKDHDVFVCANGKQALELLKKDQSFDLVLCDIMMPEFTGMDLYRTLKKEQSPVRKKFVFISGGAFTPKIQEFLDQFPKSRVLPKPFNLKEIREVIDRSLQKKAAA